MFESMLYTALPNNNYSPPDSIQCANLQRVTHNIFTQFFSPKLCAGFWHTGIETSFVTMPEATMHKYGYLIF